MTRVPRIAAWIAVLLLLSGGGFAASADDARERTGDRIEGTWLVRVDWPGFPPFQYLQHFLPGGKTSLLLTFGVPPCALTTPSTCLDPSYWSGDTRVGCLGDWTPRGRHQFDATMYCLPHQGDGYVPDRIRIKATLARDGQTFDGSGFTYEWFNPDGSVAFGGQGQMTAKRLAHVPLP
jgi:hypothetical protein